LLLRAVLRLHAAAALAVQQSIDLSYPSGPQQQTRCMLLQQANGTDGRTLYHFINPAPHIMWVVPVIRSRHGTGSPGQWVIWVIFYIRSLGHHFDPVFEKMPKKQNVHLKC